MLAKLFLVACLPFHSYRIFALCFPLKTRLISSFLSQELQERRLHPLEQQVWTFILWLIALHHLKRLCG